MKSYAANLSHYKVFKILIKRSSVPHSPSEKGLSHKYLSYLFFHHNWFNKLRDKIRAKDQFFKNIMTIIETCFERFDSNLYIDEFAVKVYETHYDNRHHGYQSHYLNKNNVLFYQCLLCQITSIKGPWPYTRDSDHPW